MAKSQGRRLKDTLRSKGLIGPISKDRKKNKKDDADIVKSIRNIFNPFDVKTTNQKHQVLGRKITGAVGKPGVSKQIGEEKVIISFEGMFRIIVLTDFSSDGVLFSWNHRGRIRQEG
jgi:hypothetical protein